MIDLALIDGDHTIRGCLKDWEVVANRLKPGGVAILHDTRFEGYSWLGPNFLIEELRETRTSECGVLNLKTPDTYGLALIQKNPETKGWKKIRPGLLDVIRDYCFTRKHWPR